MKELVKCEIEPEPLPPLEVLLEATQFISSKEVAFIYDCPQQEIERELKITTETKSTDDRSKMRTLLEMDSKEKTWCKHQVFFFTAYKNIKGDGRNFHVQTKGYMFVCEFVHAYYITRFDVR